MRCARRLLAAPPASGAVGDHPDAGEGHGFVLAGANPVEQVAVHDERAHVAELQSAVADKGGHRVRAIALVDQAMGEVQAGMDYAASR